MLFRVIVIDINPQVTGALIQLYGVLWRFATMPRTVINMGTNPIERGWTAESVSANVRRLREQRNFSLRELATRLGDAGRPLTHTALGDVELGQRRVDVDDLMALAVALDVSPISLLMPPAPRATTKVAATGTGSIRADLLWDWMTASKPLQGNVMQFWAMALPSWITEALAKGMGATLAALMEPKGVGNGDN